MVGNDPAGAEFGPAILREATLALLIRFTAYRSYGPDSESDPADRALWQTALDSVAARCRLGCLHAGTQPIGNRECLNSQFRIDAVADQPELL